MTEFSFLGKLTL